MLLVEDHSIIRQAVSLILRARGLDVVDTDDMSESGVLDAAKRFSPAVVLLDFYLDAGDSLPMIRPLTEGGSRVVMLTGVTDYRILADCLDAGAVGIVDKGDGLERLVDTVEAALDGNDVMRPGLRDEIVGQARAARAREAERAAPFQRLTPREQHVLVCLSDGKSAGEIARDEFVSVATVRSQINSILSKLDVSSQLAAVASARKAGWL